MNMMKCHFGYFKLAPTEIDQMEQLCHLFWRYDSSCFIAVLIVSTLSESKSFAATELIKLLKADESIAFLTTTDGCTWYMIVDGYISIQSITNTDLLLI